MPDVTATISKIKLANGNVYEIKDAFARQQLESIKSTVAGGVQYVGATTTELVDGATTAVVTIKKGEGTEDHTAAIGDMVDYNNILYIFNKNSQWDQLGSASPLGKLAYKDNAEGTVTPTATFETQTFTGNEATITVPVTADGDVKVSAATPSEGETANYTPAGTVSAPKFTGTEGDVTVSGVADGDVTVSVGDGAANYTPAGTLKDLKTTLTPTTDTIKPVATLGTAASLETTVADETLSINFTPNTLPTLGDAKEFVTGATAETTGGFEGAGVDLEAAFKGKTTSATGKFTPDGKVDAPGFTGTGVVVKAGFTGKEVNATATYTPEGTVSDIKATFDEKTVTVE